METRVKIWTKPFHMQIWKFVCENTAISYLKWKFHTWKCSFFIRFSNVKWHIKIFKGLRKLYYVLSLSNYQIVIIFTCTNNKLMAILCNFDSLQIPETTKLYRTLKLMGKSIYSSLFLFPVLPTFLDMHSCCWFMLPCFVLFFTYLGETTCIHELRWQHSL